MPGRHIPERTCVACRTQQPKRAMVRIVRLGNGTVAIDPTGKAAGRGAYLCKKAICWKIGLRKEILARALKATIAEADRALLENFAAGLSQEGAEPAVSGVAEGSTP